MLCRTLIGVGHGVFAIEVFRASQSVQKFVPGGGFVQALPGVDLDVFSHAEV